MLSLAGLCFVFAGDESRMSASQLKELQRNLTHGSSMKPQESGYLEVDEDEVEPSIEMRELGDRTFGFNGSLKEPARQGSAEPRSISLPGTVEISPEQEEEGLGQYDNKVDMQLLTDMYGTD